MNCEGECDERKIKELRELLIEVIGFSEMVEPIIKRIKEQKKIDEFVKVERCSG